MEAGDVVFFRAQDTWISRLVSRVTKFPYTHVALAIDGKRIIEANRFIKTRVVELELDHTQHTLYRVPDLTFEQIVKIRERALLFSGYPYDYLQIASWFFQLVFKWERDVFNRTNKLICSELIDYAYIAGGVNRNSAEGLGNVTPAMLLEHYDLREVAEDVD